MRSKNRTVDISSKEILAVFVLFFFALDIVAVSSLGRAADWNPSTDSQGPVTVPAGTTGTPITPLPGGTINIGSGWASTTIPSLLRGGFRSAFDLIDPPTQPPGSPKPVEDETTTRTNPDGSTTTSTITTRTDPDGSTTTYTTQKNPDGSTTTTATYRDGSTYTIEKYSDGSTTTTRTNPDGSTTTTTTYPDGRTTTTTTPGTTEQPQQPQSIPKPERPVLNIKLVTLGGPLDNPVIHLDPGPATTPEEFVQPPMIDKPELITGTPPAIPEEKIKTTTQKNPDGSTTTTEKFPSGVTITTTTQKNPDGSTQTRTNRNGTITETRTYPDGSTTEYYRDTWSSWTTETKKNPDGSTTTRTTSRSGVGPTGMADTFTTGDMTTTTRTNPDGSITTTREDHYHRDAPHTTTTFPDGSITRTRTNSDGSTTTTRTQKNPDGSTTMTTTYSDGSTTTTTDKTNPDGSRTRTLTFPDGSTATTTSFLDGSRVERDRDGKITFHDPPRKDPPPKVVGAVPKQPVDVSVPVDNREQTNVGIPPGQDAKEAAKALGGTILARGPQGAIISTVGDPKTIEKKAQEIGLKTDFVEKNFCTIMTPLTPFRGHDHKAHEHSGRGPHEHDAPDPGPAWGITPPEIVVSLE